jgi:hypothetical protein
MEKPKFTSVGGVPLAPTVFVKGGTLSSSQTNQIKQAEHEANQRRAKQDQEMAAAAQPMGPGSIGSLRSRKLVTEDSPRLVLWYRKQEQECVSEITMVPGSSGQLDPMFTLVCTKCLERGLPQGQAQLQVRNEHREFSIDHTKRGPKRVFFGNVPKVVNICGTVTVKDKVRCGACGWTVRIIDSKVEEV